MWLPHTWHEDCFQLAVQFAQQILKALMSILATSCFFLLRVARCCHMLSLYGKPFGAPAKICCHSIPFAVMNLLRFHSICLSTSTQLWPRNQRRVCRPQVLYGAQLVAMSQCHFCLFSFLETMKGRRARAFCFLQAGCHGPYYPYQQCIKSG